LLLLLLLPQVSVLTNGSAEGIAKAVLTGNKVMQLVKGPLLDIAMPEVSQYYPGQQQQRVNIVGSSYSCQSFFYAQDGRSRQIYAVMTRSLAWVPHCVAQWWWYYCFVQPDAPFSWFITYMTLLLLSLRRGSPSPPATSLR
jgi:hypothetical protein